MRPRELARPWSPDLGAVVGPDSVRFRVWAPRARRVAVALVGGDVPMERQADGTWEATVPGVGAGSRYKFRLDGGDSFPDPYSRAQPDGVHGPSAVVDPSAFVWHDAAWPGIGIRELVVYQCHVGTATADGTFASLIPHLDRLGQLGIGAIQTLPLAEFPGGRGWGYDGVLLFAPTRNYGGAEGFKRFVDAAHQRGLGVIVDVVYNHLGPDGNYLRQYSPTYFTDRYRTPWGEAVNYDGPESAWTRRLVLDNALSWIHEYHADGLRLDATHALYDGSERHLLQELSETVRSSLPPGRQVVLIAESSENDVRYLLPVAEGGYGMDAVWADDFHHALRRYLAGDHEGYYQDYAGTLDELARVVERGWLYEGQPSQHWGGRPRGTPAGSRPPWQFQIAIQNHDQVGNRAFGDRLNHVLDPGSYRLAAALLLFLPYTPLLFMGQEFAASTPFLYFTDHTPELGRLVTEGRRKEFGSFSQFADPARQAAIPDPQAEATFQRSKLRPDEAAADAPVTRLYRELLRLRTSDPVLRQQSRETMAAEVVREHLLLVHRWSGDRHRLLLANFGADRAQVDLSRFGPGPWQPLLNTSAPDFGGDVGDVSLAAGRIVVPPRTGLLVAADAAC